MIGTKHTGDYDLSDGTKVEVEYCFYPGGFSDEEDRLEVVQTVNIETGEALILSNAEQQRLEELVIEQHILDNEHGEDWRNEWDR